MPPGSGPGSTVNVRSKASAPGACSNGRIATGASSTIAPPTTSAYSGETDQGSGVMPISVPVDSDQVIGAERRWRGDCVRSDRNRQEEVEEKLKARGFGAKRR